ncbi:pseudouridine synthase [Spirochaetota bacterium]
MKIRVNKYLAQCGLGSRRKVETFITDGRVKINNRVLGNLSQTIDPEVDSVQLDGQIVEPIKNKYYLILNKPKGFVTSLNDERERPIVMDLIPEKYQGIGLFPVGRLDMDTEGLLLFTNDGDLANRLNHPRYKFPKEYIVEIDKPLDKKDREKIEKGVFLYQIKVKTQPCRIKLMNRSKTQVNIILHEGKKRQIRLSFQKFDYRVKKLVRTGYGPLRLTSIKKGSFRMLKKNEVRTLKEIVK